MLTDTECKNASCPQDKPRVRLADGQGLYLEVAPNGGKRWFWKYRFAGKEKRLAIGTYCRPGSKAVVMGAKEARGRRGSANDLLKSGIDPAQQRKADKAVSLASAAQTLEAVAREFHLTKATAEGWSPVHARAWLRAVDRDLFPWLGTLPIDSITAPALLAVLRKVEDRGAVRTAHDLREFAGQVFRYGIATGKCERNPASELRGALKPFVERHMSAVLEPERAGELMRSIEGYMGYPVTRAALKLSALLFQRPGNIREMEWAELDLDAGMWTIPAAKMKRSVHGKTNGRPHFVPLAPQAVQVLKDLQPLTGHGRYVFPSLRTGERPMSENTVRSALRALGYTNDDMTPHGFRAMARTIMVERLNMNPEVLEAQLAHGKSGPLGMAYDRAEFMEQRRQMMGAWADYLDQLRQGAQVLPFKAA